MKQVHCSVNIKHSQKVVKIVMLSPINFNKLFNWLMILIIFIGLLSGYDWEVSFAQPLDPSLPGYELVKPPSAPSLKIISPESNSTILGSDITVDYIISGIKLVEPDTKDLNIIGEGHIRATLARKNFPVPSPISIAKQSPLVFENLPEGDYRLTIEIVKNTGAEYKTPIVQTVKFTLNNPSPPRPTNAPKPTPTPLPLRDKVPLSNREIYLIIGIVLLIAPGTYLIAQKIKL